VGCTREARLRKGPSTCCSDIQKAIRRRDKIDWQDLCRYPSQKRTKHLASGICQTSSCKRGMELSSFKNRQIRKLYTHAHLSFPRMRCMLHERRASGDTHQFCNSQFKYTQLRLCRLHLRIAFSDWDPQNCLLYQVAFLYDLLMLSVSLQNTHCWQTRFTCCLCSWSFRGHAMCIFPYFEWTLYSCVFAQLLIFDVSALYAWRHLFANPCASSCT